MHDDPLPYDSHVFNYMIAFNKKSRYHSQDESYKINTHGLAWELHGTSLYPRTSAQKQYMDLWCLLVRNWVKNVYLKIGNCSYLIQQLRKK